MTTSERPSGGRELARIVAIMADKGASRLFVKRLSRNDNSKQQIYFGPDFAALNIFPNAGVVRDGTTFKAGVRFAWVDDDGQPYPALGAQLIFYPDYPEVRFSGFLRGARS